MFYTHHISKQPITTSIYVFGYLLGIQKRERTPPEGRPSIAAREASSRTQKDPGFDRFNGALPVVVTIVQQGDDRSGLLQRHGVNAAVGSHNEAEGLGAERGLGQADAVASGVGRRGRHQEEDKSGRGDFLHLELPLLGLMTVNIV